LNQRVVPRDRPIEIEYRQLLHQAAREGTAS
jgi:hypothetical protein